MRRVICHDGSLIAANAGVHAPATSPGDASDHTGTVCLKLSARRAMLGAWNRKRRGPSSGYGFCAAASKRRTPLAWPPWKRVTWKASVKPLPLNAPFSMSRNWCTENW